MKNLMKMELNKKAHKQKSFNKQFYMVKLELYYQNNIK